MEKTPNNVDYIHAVMNAAALRGIMDDPRWKHVVALITKLMAGAQAKERAAKAKPSLDSMIQSTYFSGQVKMAEIILLTLTRLYDRAGTVLDEARKTLPHAPTFAGEREMVTDGPEKPQDNQ